MSRAWRRVWLGPGLLVLLLAGCERGHRPALILQPLGAVDAFTLAVLQQEIRQFCRADCHLTPARGLPPATLSPRRRQYDAEAVLRDLAAVPLAPGQRLLAVADEDAGTPQLTFVYGLAEQGGSRAVVFCRRLGLGADREQYRHRLAVTARHELGHLWGLHHCPEPSCLMFYSTSIADTDAKGPGLCPACQHLWEAAR